MRYLTFSTREDGTPRLGVLHRERIVDVRWLSAVAGAPPLPATLLQLIQDGMAASHRLSEFLTTHLTRVDRVDHAADEIRWHAPIPRPPKNVACVGLNYLLHAQE